MTARQIFKQGVVGSSAGNSPLNPAPQYPTLLAGYAARAPWSAMGVDVGAGYASTVVLVAPSAYTYPTGSSLDAGNHLIRVDGSNVTLDGIDLSLEGGYEIYYTGDHLTVQNCNWKSANGNTFMLCGAGCDSAIIRQNILDGNITDSVVAAICAVSGTGTWLIEKNWMKNAFSDFVTFGAASPNVVTVTIQNNLFDNCGAGSVSEGAHPDVLQCFNTANYTVVWTRNTWRQTQGTWITAGVSCSDNANQPVCQVATYTENTFALSAVPSGSGGVNSCFTVDTSELVTTATISSNYVDPTAILIGFVIVRSDGGGPYNGTINKSGNINMVTGGAIS